MKKMYLLFLALALIKLISMNLPIAQAEENQTTIGVSPAIVESVLTPGKVTEQRIRIINSNNRPIPIKAMVKDWLGTNDTGTELNETISAKQWLTIEPADFIMEANSSREILFRILPPAGATPGGHYASVFLNPVFSQEEVMSLAGPQIVPRVTVQLMLLVKGEMREGLKVIDFRPTKSVFLGKKPEFKLEIENTGNVHLLPKMNIELKKVWPTGKKSTITEENKVVMPGQKRKLILDTMINDWGKYEVMGEIKYGTFEEKVNLNNNFFWILPPIWMFILVVFALTSTVGMLIMKYRDV